MAIGGICACAADLVNNPFRVKHGFYWLCLKRFNMQSVSGALFLTPPATMVWAYVQFGDPFSSGAIAGNTRVWEMNDRSPTMKSNSAKKSGSNRSLTGVFIA